MESMMKLIILIYIQMIDNEMECKESMHNGQNNVYNPYKQAVLIYEK